MRRGAVVGVLVVTLLAAACSDKKEALGPTATLQQPTTTIDPYAIPPVIDEAYVNRVLAGLDHAVGDVTRLIFNAKTITNEAADRLEALYALDALVLKLQSYENDVFGGFAGYRPNPGDKRTVVEDLLSARSDCIFARVTRDFSQVTADPNARPSTQWVALVPRNAAKDPLGYNMLNWMYGYEGFRPDRTAPPDPCVE